MAKLRHEILEIIGSDRAPSFEDIRNCSYLQKTISETLRLYPAVPFNLRLALKDTTLPHGAGADGLQPVGVLKDTPIGACSFQSSTFTKLVVFITTISLFDLACVSQGYTCQFGRLRVSSSCPDLFVLLPPSLLHSASCASADV